MRRESIRLYDRIGRRADRSGHFHNGSASHGDAAIAVLRQVGDHPARVSRRGFAADPRLGE